MASPRKFFCPNKDCVASTGLQDSLLESVADDGLSLACPACQEGVTACENCYGLVSRRGEPITPGVPGVLYGDAVSWKSTCGQCGFINVCGRLRIMLTNEDGMNTNQQITRVLQRHISEKKFVAKLSKQPVPAANDESPSVFGVKRRLSRDLQDEPPPKRQRTSSAPMAQRMASPERSRDPDIIPETPSNRLHAERTLEALADPVLLDHDITFFAQQHRRAVLHGFTRKDLQVLETLCRPISTEADAVLGNARDFLDGMADLILEPRPCPLDLSIAGVASGQSPFQQRPPWRRKADEDDRVLIALATLAMRKGVRDRGPREAQHRALLAGINTELMAVYAALENQEDLLDSEARRVPLPARPTPRRVASAGVSTAARDNLVSSLTIAEKVSELRSKALLWRSLYRTVHYSSK